HEQPRAAKSVKAPQASKAGKAQATVKNVKITHPERIIDKHSGTQKQQLAQFYTDISEWILPFLRARAVSLLRAPEGIEGEQFF
ncbi:UNVERIFIED_CONTAM: hypothetical protein ITH59_24185, partial [Salmonella enterica subsp. enterica serovar Weltevreden]